MPVYIFRAIGVDRIKVGVSNDVARRHAEVQALSPVQIEIVEIFEHGDYDIEKIVHGLLWAHRSHGEWFVESEGLAIAQRWFAIMRSAAQEIALLIQEQVPEEKHADLRKLFSRTSADLITAALANLVGESIMDRRHG